MLRRRNKAGPVPQSAIALNRQSKAFLVNSSIHIKKLPSKLRGKSPPKENVYSTQKTLQYANLFNDILTRSEFRVSEVVHTGVVHLKKFTNSDFVYVYMIEKDEIFLSLNIYNIPGRQRWKVVENSSYLAAGVAYKREYVLIKDIRKDKRYLDSCHIPDGNFIPSSVLCVPMVTENECYAVLEFQRGPSKQPYTIDNAKFVVVIVGWISAALRQRFERVNFENDMKIEDDGVKLLQRVLQPDVNTNTLSGQTVSFLKKIVNAEKCIYLQFGLQNGELVTYVFREGLVGSKCEIVRQMFRKKVPIKFHEDDQDLLAQAVKTRDIINISDVYNSKFCLERVKKLSGLHIRSLVTCPIWNATENLGLVILLNKKGSLSFTKVDESLLSRYSLYLALAMEHIRRHDNMGREKLEIEVYKEILQQQIKPCAHMTVERKVKEDLTEIFPKLAQFDWYISSDKSKYVHHLAFYMFKDVIGKQSLDWKSTVTFFQSVQKSYRSNPYHNFEHGFTVCHCMYTMLKANMELFTPLEKMALMVASLCHDVDHPGINNNFLTLTEHYLALLYDESPLEYHHTQLTKILLGKSTMFKNLNKEAYDEIETEVENAILATDLVRYFRERVKLLQLCRDGTFDWQNKDHRLSLKCIMMNLSDLSGMMKTVNVVKYLTNNIYREFYHQGDLERKLGYTPIPMMDRHKRHMVPEDQALFMEIVVIPCVELVTNILPNTEALYDNSVAIRNYWLGVKDKGPEFWKKTDDYDDKTAQNIVKHFEQLQKE